MAIQSNLAGVARVTPDEAAAIDAANREKLEKGRTGRFAPFVSGEEHQARAKRVRRR